ncbi:MAG TPA: UDP-N-acetylmuramate dehydrogenase [Candidatus Paceibacterota bacterium]|nr:UDP-N-acetylmuramate dehydrogenase [Verrucomicrobiota bacterium]HSA11503.1 UDP-N-acetylmuramate dehydrogenase [Candidatus Paceibacterota bacterium]
MPRGAMADQEFSSRAEAAGELAQRVSKATVIRNREPLAKHTTLRVGGSADLYVEPATDLDLAAVLAYCQESSRPVFLLGRGSNLLVRDGGIRGAVICLSHTHFSQIEVADERICCGAGARLRAIAAEAKRHGLAGMEFLEGIPGSVGGALRMNAGAMGSAMFNVVESVRLMSLDGQVRQRAAHELTATYRECSTLKTHIALSAVLRGHSDSRKAIELRMTEYSRKRWQSQPAAPSAGCIFKNPGSIPAGKLIDELGLKGTRVGGAMVSAEHGNFIVNDGTASARDILELIEVIKQRARTERGIELQTEVEIVGE